MKCTVVVGYEAAGHDCLFELDCIAVSSKESAVVSKVLCSARATALVGEVIDSITNESVESS